MKTFPGLISLATVAALVLVGVSNAAPPAPPAASTLDLRTILPVCEQALAAAIGGREAGPVLEQGFKALPDDEKAAALGVCQVYALGAVSMLKHLQAAPKVPAGGTSI